MSQLPVKLYQPNTPGQSARIAQEEWQKHESRIRELHAANRTSREIRDILCKETHNGFQPS